MNSGRPMSAPTETWPPPYGFDFEVKEGRPRFCCRCFSIMCAAECLVLWYGGGLPREAMRRDVGRMIVDGDRERGKEVTETGMSEVNLLDKRCGKDDLFFGDGFETRSSSCSGSVVATC